MENEDGQGKLREAVKLWGWKRDSQAPASHFWPAHDLRAKCLFLISLLPQDRLSLIFLLLPPLFCAGSPGTPPEEMLLKDLWKEQSADSRRTRPWLENQTLVQIPALLFSSHCYVGQVN